MTKFWNGRWHYSNWSVRAGPGLVLESPYSAWSPGLDLGLTWRANYCNAIFHAEISSWPRVDPCLILLFIPLHISTSLGAAWAMTKFLHGKWYYSNWSARAGPGLVLESPYSAWNPGLDLGLTWLANNCNAIFHAEIPSWPRVYPCLILLFIPLHISTSLGPAWAMTKFLHGKWYYSNWPFQARLRPRPGKSLLCVKPRTRPGPDLAGQ